MVTYIQEKRGGGAAAGYISSGFFGGLALGRVLLMGLHRLVRSPAESQRPSFAHPRADRRKSRHVSLHGASHRVSSITRHIIVSEVLDRSLQATVWAVPSLIENGIAVSVIGLFLGGSYCSICAPQRGLTVAQAQCTP
jgi:hypothetical protein